MKCRIAGVLTLVSVGFLLFAEILLSQESTRRSHIGAPQDWTQRQIIFSRDALLQHPDILTKEPRVLQEAIRRWQGRYSTVVPGIELAASPAAVNSSPADWSIGLQDRLALNMYPSKFSFDLNATPDCLNDYVVFATAAVGVTGGKENLIGLNNLYSGTGGLCGAAPNVLFSYNVTTTAGGHVVTSPVLSLDGKKIAFVESVPAPNPPAAIFHVLTWKARDGSLGHAAPPNMTTLPFAAINSTTSSPWVDYRSDTAYVGANDGKIYKITGVFKGTPTLVTSNPWPVLLATNIQPTPPVLDAGRHKLMVGGSDGKLYQIDTVTGVLSSLSIGQGRNHGILGTPIVDVTNGTTFVVSANDGTSGVLVEADTVSLAQLAKATIGLASASGTNVNLYQPAFSDSYFTDPSTGVARLCGTGPKDITPFQYAFGFSGRTMQTTPAFQQQLLTSPNARCTAWTEVFNSTLGIDFFLFGLTADCTTVGAGAPDGCVVSRSSDTVLTKATVTGGPSGIVIDNVSVAGQASSIYFTARNVNTAFKFKQDLGVGP